MEEDRHGKYLVIQRKTPFRRRLGDSLLDNSGSLRQSFRACFTWCGRGARGASLQPPRTHHTPSFSPSRSLRVTPPLPADYLSNSADGTRPAAFHFTAHTAPPYHPIVAAFYTTVCLHALPPPLCRRYTRLLSRCGFWTRCDALYTKRAGARSATRAPDYLLLPARLRCRGLPAFLPAQFNLPFRIRSFSIRAHSARPTRIERILAPRGTCYSPMGLLPVSCLYLITRRTRFIPWVGGRGLHLVLD